MPPPRTIHATNSLDDDRDTCGADYGLCSHRYRPTPEARQALAPTGKLRVGLQLGSPHNVIADPVTGEMKGVGYDLGKELARRIGVPFEPVM